MVSSNNRIGRTINKRVFAWYNILSAMDIFTLNVNLSVTAKLAVCQKDIEFYLKPFRARVG